MSIETLSRIDDAIYTHTESRFILSLLSRLQKQTSADVFAHLLRHHYTAQTFNRFPEVHFVVNKFSAVFFKIWWNRTIHDQSHGTVSNHRRLTVFSILKLPLPLFRKADIALIGLAVMGQNLILNMDSKGFVVCAYNRTVDKVSLVIIDE